MMLPLRVAARQQRVSSLQHSHLQHHARLGLRGVPRPGSAAGPFRTYVTPSPITTAAPSVQPIKKKRRTGLRLTLGALLLLTTFYGGSLYGSQVSERYRDFFVTEVPLGEAAVQAWEERNGIDKDLVKRLSQKAKLASGKSDELQKKRDERMKEFNRIRDEKAAQAKAKAAEVQQVVTGKVEKGEEQAKKAAEVVKQKTAEVAQKVENAVGKAVNAAREGADEATQAIKDGLPSAPTTSVPASSPVYAKETVPVDYQRPRQLDASPQAPKLAPAQPYTAPLPVGFEPPPGYAVPRASKKGDKVAPEAKPAPPPLPLVAPTVSELSASEPVLGQLAGTIDSLARYLNDSPSAIGDKGAREVINTASLDLRNLGKRLSDVKDEERVKLEQVLKEKTDEYNRSLMQAEKELVVRLESQEENWKGLFDKERKELVDAYKSKLDGELSVQKELIEQRLKEEVIAQGIELQRRWLSEVKNRVESERNGRLGKLEDLQENVEKLSKTTLGSAEWLDENRNINKLWTAIRTLWKSSVDSDTNGVDGPRGFERELSALMNVAKSSEASAGEDNILSSVLSSIPASVTSSGVESFPVLSTWYTSRLSPKILKASFFPQDGGFVSYLSSSFLSLFLFQKVGFVQGEDVVSTLSRAEWYITNRDLESAVREINQLTGWPKILARDWLVAARRHLEVRQAIQVAEAEAGLRTLLIL